ncbi:MAG TPA: acetyl-CoA decarbonylase/synthase complex subunit gamma [Candidatus Omnitrophota bacterium]|nr:acetyl-CoA decarbonylase/synthase complex subunit gamma [Candidatus Omnitrophota bacterium]
MALSGLDIYKLLPKTNCKECGFPTCLAFAMQLAKKAVSIDKCPTVTVESKAALEQASQPPIRLVSIGTGDNKFDIGNETVLFRHEEKFRSPCGIGFIIEDSETDDRVKARVGRINELRFERVGQSIQANCVAVRQCADAKRFAAVVSAVSSLTPLAIVLMPRDAAGLKAVLPGLKGKRPLVYGVTADTLQAYASLAKEFNVPVVACGRDLDGVSGITQELNKLGINDILLDTGSGKIADRIWALTQIRRLALKKSNRTLGYPCCVVVDNPDPCGEVLEAAAYILKYAGLVLMRGIESWQAYSLLTLRQNIYTDPQKPLQIEPKLYEIGKVSERSPVLVTTNFSLSYFTVLGEVEGSKVPSYILSVDTEGQSVLTAGASEKFTPEKISDTLKKLDVKARAPESDLVIPGYVAVMSGDLEEQSGWKVVVGPKEASGIPSFLKNL